MQSVAGTYFSHFVGFSEDVFGVFNFRGRSYIDASFSLTNSRFSKNELTEKLERDYTTITIYSVSKDVSREAVCNIAVPFE